MTHEAALWRIAGRLNVMIADLERASNYELEGWAAALGARPGTPIEEEDG